MGPGDELPRFMPPASAPDSDALILMRAETGSGVAQNPAGGLIARVRMRLTLRRNRSHEPVELTIYAAPEMAAEWGQQLIDGSVAAVQDLGQLGPEIGGDTIV